VRSSDERNAIVAALEEAGSEALGANQIAATSGMKVTNVRRLLSRMRMDGIVRKAKYGKYTLESVTAEASRT
jgi:DNA-binding IclR family transcriptional regulator